MKKSLFPIPLIGMGTSEIESLPSYLHRLAFEHGIYVGELLKFIYCHGISDIDEDDSVALIPHYLRVESLVRPNKVTNTIIRLLKVMGGSDASNGTFCFLDGSVGRLSNEISKGFKWCPECFAEMKSIGEDCYFKLIWHLEDITQCPIHGAPLVSSCGFCGCKQTSYIKRNLLGSCQECGESLSVRHKTILPSEVRNSWELCGVDLMQLFKDLEDGSVHVIHLDGAKKSLEHLFDYFWTKQRGKDLFSVIPRDKLLSVIYEQSKISLKSARRFAYSMGIPLYDFLSGHAHQSSAVLNSHWVCGLQPSFMAISEKSSHDHLKVISAIKKVTQDSKEPLSLKQVAKKVDVSVGYIEYRHPAVKNAIVKAHEKYRKELRAQKQNRATAAALSFFTEKKYYSYNKSRKQAYRVIREETGLPKFVLKRAINQVYSTFHDY